VEDSAGRLRVEERGREFDPGITIPNGGWNAPLGDVAAWARFLTHSPSPDTAVTARYDAVLSRGSLEEMWQPVVTADSGIAPSSMGLSFFLTRLGTDTLVGHIGEQGGYRAFLFLNRRTRRAVLGVVNTTNEAEYDPALARWHAKVRAALDVIAR
jgi:CubicO group peptidase (beta-lactamase class C family)